MSSPTNTTYRPVDPTLPTTSRVAGAALAELIGPQELFRGVEAASLEPILRETSVMSLDPGQVLIGAEQTNRHLYLVLEGRFAVHLGSLDEPPLVHVTPGESIGELSLIDGRPSSAWVVAENDARVLALDEELVWLLVNTFHAVSSNLLYILARRLRYGNDVISEDRQQLREYRFQATIDSLTELFNRHWLGKMLPRLVERSHRSSEPLSLLMFDIDHFKRVNDKLGHPAGDAVLREVATRLRAGIRALDLPARYGGEEFVLVCPGTGGDAAAGLAERLRGEIAARPISVATAGETREAAVTISAGVAEAGPCDDANALIQRADEALYQAKRGGRNRVCVA